MYYGTRARRRGGGQRLRVVDHSLGKPPASKIIIGVLGDREDRGFKFSAGVDRNSSSRAGRRLSEFVGDILQEIEHLAHEACGTRARCAAFFSVQPLRAFVFVFARARPKTTTTTRGGAVLVRTCGALVGVRDGLAVTFLRRFIRGFDLLPETRGELLGACALLRNLAARLGRASISAGRFFHKGEFVSLRLELSLSGARARAPFETEENETEMRVSKTKRESNTMSLGAAEVRQKLHVVALVVQLAEVPRHAFPLSLVDLDGAAGARAPPTAIHFCSRKSKTRAFHHTFSTTAHDHDHDDNDRDGRPLSSCRRFFSSSERKCSKERVREKGPCPKKGTEHPHGLVEAQPARGSVSRRPKRSHSAEILTCSGELFLHTRESPTSASSPRQKKRKLGPSAGRRAKRSNLCGKISSSRTSARARARARERVSTDATPGSWTAEDRPGAHPPQP